MPATKKRGFTLIETLVSLAVLSLFFVAIALIFQELFKQIGLSRVRTTARSLAQSKLELIRNLPYTSVGTIGGIPQGPIEQNELVERNGAEFTVTTSVAYEDDPFDGVAPADIINTDYKRVRVEVTWGGLFPSTKPLVLVTNIAPKGIETVEGGGTLMINVANAGGLPVSNATVTITNTSVAPPINLQTLTNMNGLVVLPGAPECIACYEITVTKPGFSTDKTQSTATVANPLLPHATVLEGEVTQLTFGIDQTGQFIIRSFGSADSGYPPIANVQFTLRGNKVIGYDTNDDPVYKYSFATNTGGGIVTISNLEWDTYTLDFTSSSHNLAGSNPLLPVVLLPTGSVSVAMVNVPKSNTTLLVNVAKGGGELLASAAARLIRTSGGYDTTKITAATGSADFGQAFFGSLTPGSYELRVNLSGYQEATSSLTLTQNQTEQVTLNTFTP